MRYATVDVRGVLDRLHFGRNPAALADGGFPKRGPGLGRPLRDAGPLRALAPLHDYQPGAHPIAAGPTIAHSSALAAGIGLLVIVASVVAVAPARPDLGGATGNVEANSLGVDSGLRLAVGGAEARDSLIFESTDEGPRADAPATIDGAPADLAAGIQAFSTLSSEDAVGGAATDERAAAPDLPDGPFLADGTLLKPVAVDTSIPDAKSILISYRIKKGDSLSAIASRYKISLSTLWWANHVVTGLTGTTELHIGQRLVIPPVNGAIHVVTDRETIADIARRTKVPQARIVAANKLTEPTLHVGQWILIPGAKNKPVPLPKPAPPPPPPPKSTAASPGTHSTVRARAPSNYSGGQFHWPVPGGYISQYFHAGHYALDIAGTYGEPVEAAAGGVVVFSGWRNNGGGYQVWLSHGGGLYTGYYHMSAVIVGAGQSVGRGQQIGRLGMTGWATGPHCHFEVWIGPVDVGYRVNPLNYF